jgi:hypothetical protein
MESVIVEMKSKPTIIEGLLNKLKKKHRAEDILERVYTLRNEDLKKKFGLKGEIIDIVLEHGEVSVLGIKIKTKEGQGYDRYIISK